MTTIVNSKWANAVDGDYSVASNWLPNGVPTFTGGVEHDVLLGGNYTNGTSAFTVTSSANEFVGFVDVEANATFAISAGLFTVYTFNHPFSAIYNFGAITVAAGANLRIGLATSPNSASSTFQNRGTFAVSGVLSLAAPWFNLLGSGVLKLTGSILGARTSSVAVLANEASNIQGSGLIGNGATLQLINAFGGVINATGKMTINTGANWITDSGLIETTGAGTLSIDSDMQLDGGLKSAGTGWIMLLNAYVGGGGVITVGAGTSLLLNNGQMSIGGAITVAAAGYIRTTAGNTAQVGVNNDFVGDTIQDGEIENAGQILIVNNSTLNLNCTVDNTGSIVMLGGTAPTQLEVFGDGLTLTNTGGLIMSNSVNNSIVSNGTAVSLLNQTKISGAGVIGDGWLRFVNQLGSSLTANGSARLTLFGDTTGVEANAENENYNDGTIANVGAGGLMLSGGTFSNAGYLTENGAGALTLNGVSIDNGGGIVRALKGSIVLRNSLIFNQAYVSIAVGATLTTSSGDANDGLYGPIRNNGTVNAVAGSTLGVAAIWTNSGVVNVGGASGGSTITQAAGSDWELLGGGTFNMANAGDSIISAGSGTFFQDKSNLIIGGGAIGDANMSVNIQNDGKIDATLASGMILNAEGPTSTTTNLYNAGVLQSDSAGGLTIQTAMYSGGQMIVNNGAKIVAQGAVYGSGSSVINGTGSIEFASRSDNNVTFGASTGGELILDTSHQFNGTTYGFAAGDAIDLRDFAFVAGHMALDTATSTIGTLDSGLHITNGATDSTNIWLQGNYTAAYLSANHLAFQFASDGHTISGTTDGTLLKLVSTA